MIEWVIKQSTSSLKYFHESNVLFLVLVNVLFTRILLVLVV